MLPACLGLLIASTVPFILKPASPKNVTATPCISITYSCVSVLMFVPLFSEDQSKVSVSANGSRSPAARLFELVLLGVNTL